MDWQEKKFDEVFERVCSVLIWRFRNNAEYTVCDLEDSLRSLYVNQGNNWDGRGEVAELTLAATIAAHEHVIAELKNQSVEEDQ